MAHNAMREKRTAYRIFVEEPKREKPLERPRRRWEDNIKMDPREVGWGSMDWIRVAQDSD
jgi:hypothetical protein